MTNNLISARVTKIYPKMQENRRTIHQNPELSFFEYETTDFIKAKLDELNIKYNAITDTGLVAHIGTGNRCVALRADIDALPIEEETGLEFTSRNKGVMHACGHDMHTSMLLGAAEILKSMETEINGTIKLIFQPAEEKLPGGASMMISNGVLENPKPEAIFGQHIYPSAPVGSISLASGPVLASADEIYINLYGKSSHAAQPHLGNNPILAATNIINHFQALITNFKDPLMPGVINITAIHGGSAPNIVPEKIEMMGTLRAYDEKWRKKMHKLIYKHTTDIAALFDIKAEINIVKGYPAVVNNPKISNFTRDVATNMLGKNNVLEFIPKMWAEDFAYYAQLVPGTFWFLGVVPEGLNEIPPLHNCKINPDENAMINGTTMLVASAVEFLKS